MSDPAGQTRSVLLVDAELARAKRRAAAFASEQRIALLAIAPTLTDAYNLTESKRPALVVVTRRLADEADFAMFACLLRMLDIPLLLLGDDPPPPLPDKLLPRLHHHEDRDCGLGLAEAIARSLAAGAIGSPLRQPRKGGPAVVVIGASTGGVEALCTVLAHAPPTCPPILIVQHIRPDFLMPLAARLNNVCPADVMAAEDGAVLETGRVLVAPGNERHLVLSPVDRLHCRLEPGPPVSGHRPSVDRLFHSAAKLGAGSVGVLLTGMGRDGAEGLAAIRRAGGRTIAQDRESCVVYGMPRAARELDAVMEELPLSRIGAALFATESTTPDQARAGAGRPHA